MNNTTIQKVLVKLRGDNVYDIYKNNEHIISTGSIERACEEVKNLLENKEWAYGSKVINNQIS